MVVFKDLSVGLKIGVVGGWIAFVSYVGYFSIIIIYEMIKYG